MVSGPGAAPDACGSTPAHVGAGTGISAGKITMRMLKGLVPRFQDFFNNAIICFYKENCNICNKVIHLFF